MIQYVQVCMRNCVRNDCQVIHVVTLTSFRVLQSIMDILNILLWKTNQLHFENGMEST